MDENNKLINMLNEIYQAAIMGAESLELLIGKSKDAQFCSKLKMSLSCYNDIKQQIAALLTQNGQKPKDVKKTKKAELWLGVNINTLIDNTSSHMAQMLIQGSTMGIIEVVKQKNLHPDATFECLEIADKFLAMLQSDIEDMKCYLK